MSELFDRVLSRTDLTGQCWVWLGGRNTKGYGEISVNGRSIMVHRLSYMENVGPIPDGLVIDHLCHDPSGCPGGRCAHRLCVNPSHLRATTNAENLRRQTPAMKTHCKHGHERTPENLAEGDGRRYCIPCRREYQKNYERPSEPARIRAWARANGIQVGVRGRLDTELIRAFERSS